MRFDWELVVRGIGEYSSSSMFFVLGCLGTTKTMDINNSFLQTGLNFGLIVLTITQCFSCVSGAHINPVITIAAFIVGEIKWDMGLVYVICQCLGAFSGYGFAYYITPEHGLYARGETYCVTLPGDGMNAVGVFFIEYVLTASWVFAMCSVWDPRNANYKDSQAIRIGLVVGCLSIIGGAFSGASMNPFRSLIPAVFMSSYDKLWIYIVSPLIAGILTPFLWIFFYKEETLIRILHPEDEDED